MTICMACIGVKSNLLVFCSDESFRVPNKHFSSALRQIGIPSVRPSEALPPSPGPCTSPFHPTQHPTPPLTHLVKDEELSDLWSQVYMPNVK